MAGVLTPHRSTVDELLEDSWANRDRAIRGRELRLELAITAAFTCVAGVLVLGTERPIGSIPLTVALVAAYALATRAEFPIGAASFIPTQLILVPMFAVTPAPVVPALVFAAFALAAVGAAARGSARLDRLAFSAGDSVHALGPALVLTLLADGDATQAAAWVVALAFLAQLAADLLSSSLHELPAMGARPRVHLRMIAQVWGVDVALSTVGLLAALEAVEHPWAALLPLPLVLLLGSLARDRTDKVAAAHERLVALERERGRRQAAAQLLERQTHFLQDVSHELRTPITIARGHVEMLLRRSPRRRGDVGVALDELERIERIVERMLLLVRAGEPRTVARERLDAESFLEDRFVRWSDTVPRPWQLGALAPGTLIGDGDALRAALDALIENAIKHTTPAQAIRLCSRLDRGQLVVEVADEGPGVAPEALEHIFERFARADTARKFGSDGLGLGLAIADAVARAHGGTCTVSSSPAGSTFALRLAGFEPGRHA